MQIGALVDLVLLKINGGKPSTDNSVIRVDIRAMLPVAFNYAVDATYNENIKVEDDRDLPSEFYAVFENVSINRATKQPHIVLEKGTVPLKGNAGVRFVYDNCGHYYAPLTDTAMPMIGYYATMTPNMYWYRRVVDKIFLYNTNPLIESLNYQALTDIDDLLDTDEAPIQAGKENMVIEWLVNWFSKKEPYDNKIDSRDDANALPYK